VLAAPAGGAAVVPAVLAAPAALLAS
jgi:hypothetical protein